LMSASLQMRPNCYAATKIATQQQNDAMCQTRTSGL
jgi:hypothetical protein